MIIVVIVVTVCGSNG